MANIFNSTEHSAALSQVRDHEKEYEKRKERKGKINEHGPVSSTHEPVYVATSKQKATRLSAFHQLIERLAAHARLYLTQITGPKRRESSSFHRLMGNHTAMGH